MAKKSIETKKILTQARKKVFVFCVEKLGMKRGGLKLTQAIEAYRKYFKLPPATSKDSFLLMEWESGRMGKVKHAQVKQKDGDIKHAGFPTIKAKETKNYNVFLKGKYWEMIRNAVVLRDDNKCMGCGTSLELHVHHKTYTNHLNEHNHLEDLITLCKYCHDKEHKK
jgi:hypothetical protein